MEKQLQGEKIIMKCANCGNDKIVDSYTSYYRKEENAYFIIENVPCKVCVQCGETFFSLKDLEEIDKLIKMKLKDKNKLNLFDFKLAE